jgi:APA family basic amino acid/polyamine antiporter
VAKKTIAIAVIATFTAIHRRGLKLGAAVQNVLTALKVVLIVGLVAVGFGFGRGSLGHLEMSEGFVLDFSGAKTAALALMWIMFAYSGWNASAYIGSEIRDPRRNLPRSLLLGTGIVMVLYLALNLLFIFALPPSEMGGVISIAGLAVAGLFGEASAAAVSLLIAFALFSSLSAFIILGPRVYYAMASDDVFFRFAAEVHPNHGVPSKSIVLQGLAASVMVLLGTFDQILTYMGFALGIFPLLAVIGVFRLRTRGELAFRMPGYPLTPLFYMATCSTILVLAFLERPTESSIALTTVAVGVPVYAIFRARAGASSSP